MVYISYKKKEKKFEPSQKIFDFKIFEFSIVFFQLIENVLVNPKITKLFYVVKPVVN